MKDRTGGRQDASQNILAADASKHRSQVEALVAVLRSRSGEWVNLVEVIRAGGVQYGARIHYARHVLGLQIENLSQRIDGVRHTWFRLLEANNQPRLSAPKVTPPQLPIQGNLFGGPRGQ